MLKSKSCLTLAVCVDLHSAYLRTVNKDITRHYVEGFSWLLKRELIKYLLQRTNRKSATESVLHEVLLHPFHFFHSCRQSSQICRRFNPASERLVISWGLERAFLF